jgi:hypothetical protein
LRPNGSALSCEPQRLRGSLEAPMFQCQTLPEVDWNELWLVSCSALLGGGQVSAVVGTLQKGCDEPNEEQRGVHQESE